MRGRFELGHGVAWNIFISEKAHFTQRSDTLFLISVNREHMQGRPQGLRRRGLDSCAKYPSIPAIGHQANDEVNGEAIAANHWLTSQYHRIKNNTRRIGHGFLLERLS